MAFSKRAPRAGAFSKVAAEAVPVDEPSAAPAYSSRADAEPYPAPAGRSPQPAQPAGSRGGGDDDEWWRSSAKKREEAERRERQEEVALRNRELAAKTQAERAEEAMRKRREKQKAAGETSREAGAEAASRPASGSSSRPSPPASRGYSGFSSSDLEQRLGVGLPGRAGQSRGLGAGFSGMQSRSMAGRGSAGIGQPLGAGAPVTQSSGKYGGFMGFGARAAGGAASAAQQRKDMIGTSISVHNYSLKPELNGLFGTLKSFDELGQQWEVELQNGETVKLRDAQIALVQWADEPGGPENAALPANLECYAGHYLVEDVAEGEYECSCDVCDADIAPKEKFLYCESCDYGVCRQCAAREVDKTKRRGPARD